MDFPGGRAMELERKERRLHTQSRVTREGDQLFIVSVFSHLRLKDG